MSEYRIDEITYDNDWQSMDRAQPLQSTENQSVELPPPQKPKRRFVPLITIQLLLCIVIGITVFMLKAMNSDTYHKLCEWYDDLMRETLVDNSTFEDIDLNAIVNNFDNLFTATSDEV